MNDQIPGDSPYYKICLNVRQNAEELEQSKTEITEIKERILQIEATILVISRIQKERSKAHRNALNSLFVAIASILLVFLLNTKILRSQLFLTEYQYLFSNLFLVSLGIVSSIKFLWDQSVWFACDTSDRRV